MCQIKTGDRLPTNQPTKFSISEEDERVNKVEEEAVFAGDVRLEFEECHHQLVEVNEIKDGVEEEGNIYL